MSQDNPNPSDSKSQPSVTQPPSSKQTSLQRVRSTSIKVLRSTSRALETIATKVEATPDDSLPFVSPKLQNQARSLWQRFLPVWNKLLGQIRTRLPGDVSQKLGDRALSGMVVSVAIGLFWVTSSLFSSKPAEVALVKATPPKNPPVETLAPDRVIPDPTSFPTELSAPVEEVPAPTTVAEVPVAEVPIAEVPIEEPIPEVPTEEPITEAVPEATPEAVISEEPAEVPVAEEPAEAIAAEEPTPEPSPEPVAPLPELTPEEKLIASIQNGVVEVADPYVSELIRSVQPNFRSSRLTVQVNPNWYTLSASQQNELADKLLNRSQSLDFSQLKITDSDGTVLARSPVVGSSMVILKRKLLTEEIA
ncbi:hypothetical protein [Phormidesmis sp. 146-33]